MNWVASSANGWHPRSGGWGLGVVGGHPSHGGDDAPVRWQDCSLTVDGDVLTARYECRGWAVTVTRRPDGDGLDELITVRNTLDRSREVGSLWIYTPFNVDLVGAAGDLRQRCHAHVWAGGRETWIKAVRWSGEGVPVTLRVHTGHFFAYGLDAATEYAGSPVRGDLCLMAPGVGDRRGHRRERRRVHRPWAPRRPGHPAAGPRRGLARHLAGRLALLARHQPPPGLSGGRTQLASAGAVAAGMALSTRTAAMAAAVARVSVLRTRLRAEAPSSSNASCSPSCSGWAAPASRAASMSRAAKAIL
jgi:hypothetical protein